MPEYAGLVERQPARGIQISGDSRAAFNRFRERREAGIVGAHPGRSAGEGVAQALDKLEQREIDIAQGVADAVGGPRRVLWSAHARNTPRNFGMPVSEERRGAALAASFWSS